ncbi:hypothetical protein JKF63_05500 [Porcisia hertigi]|uniref:Kinesin motor domain-containing protein n=1 Tax=Porcisia hertigi TaxID=2761500 RepID=A0A836IA70_9TRYP|nr:hypothetical protein JKF63_05500 [Porcisia hertigi]
MSKAAVSRPRVYVRIRPLNDRELREGKGELACHGDPHQPDVLFLKKDETLEKQVRFDKVFGQDSNQQAIFDQIGPEILRTLFSGYNASIFAYGQTGSGKTYTMEGDKSGGSPSEDQEGLMPRLIRGIFASFRSNADITDALVEVSLVQIYQEHIQDLLNHRKQVEIHMDRTSQYVARDATWRTVRSLEECMKLYGEASKMRATSSTEMNLVSSRSHMILMLRMQWDEPTLPGSHAQLNMIDLAGSERLNESGATGETLKETITINKSLSALGNVVVRLVEQAKRPNRRIHIPYKDSKITYLLQSSLGGANLVHFVLAVSSSAMWRNETTSTIEFGKRALQLVLRPVRNAIDYTRLAEMEAMIERMRSHIESLEEELQLKRNTEAAGFLQLRQISQSDDDATQRRLWKDKGATHRHLKRQTELTRIMENMPETFDDLTSHCVLFPESKSTFRELGGLQRLIHFVEKSASNYYRASAAHTITSVIDEPGRALFASLGGLDALAMLLQVQEERCKEAACVALEAVCRGCLANKMSLSADVYAELVNLVYGYSNQQVQEAACAAIATIVDGYAEATRRFEKLDVAPKLLETIRTCPAEVVNLTKAATNCIGRLAHGDKEMQQTIASLGGVDLLIDVLFSSSGDRDHQVPILASYALVNLCCSSEENLEIAKEHTRYAEVKFRLLEGLARAFGTNTSREGFGRATAQEAVGPFPYYGVTIQDEWTYASSGGRPIFSSFMDNPQFYLYVREETDIAFIIQDTLYEARMRKKRRNNSVYMGIALFEGDPTLAKLGLKQLDFHGRMIEIGRYTSNCENVLHCTLPASDTPYMVVPFTSQKGRRTRFALSAFANQPIELTSVPAQVGWVHTVLQGKWTEFTGHGGDFFDWRCNPQIRLRTKEACRVVFVLSYLSLDEQRAQFLQDEEEGEGQNTRPRLHGRLFSNTFAPDKRYLKAIVPLPQGSTFVASNTFASNSYITTSATLEKDTDYVYIPFTEFPFQDTYRVSVYCDSDEVEIEPMQGQSSEWMCATLSGVWEGKPISVTLKTTGRMIAVMYSPGAFVRPRLFGNTKNYLAGNESYWNAEAAVEYNSQGELTLQVEAMMRTGVVPAAPPCSPIRSSSKHATQVPARDVKFDLFIFTDHKCTVTQISFHASPSSWPCPTQSTSLDFLAYPQLVEDVEPVDGDDEDNSGDFLSQISADEPPTQETREGELLRSLEKQESANRVLKLQLEQQARELDALRSGSVCTLTKTNGDGRCEGGARPPVPKTLRRTSSVEKNGGDPSGGVPRSNKGVVSDMSESALMSTAYRNPASGSSSGLETVKGAAVGKQLASELTRRGSIGNNLDSSQRRTASTSVKLMPTNNSGKVDNSAPAAPLPQARESVEYTLAKLSRMSKRAAIAVHSAGYKENTEWREMLKDIEEVQQRLFNTLHLL